MCGRNQTSSSKCDFFRENICKNLQSNRLTADLLAGKTGRGNSREKSLQQRSKYAETPIPPLQAISSPPLQNTSEAGSLASDRTRTAFTATSCYPAFLCLLSSCKKQRSQGIFLPWLNKAVPGGTSRYPAFLCLLSFLVKRKGGLGISPLPGQGRFRRHVPLPRFSLPTFFSREKRGIQGGRYPPWRDKAAFGGTSRYPAFLCLLSFLAKRK